MSGTMGQNVNNYYDVESRSEILALHRFIRKYKVLHQMKEVLAAGETRKGAAQPATAAHQQCMPMGTTSRGREERTNHETRTILYLVEPWLPMRS